MKTPSHAGGSSGIGTALRILVGLLLGLGVFLAAVGALSLRVARRVVTPAPRTLDTGVLGLDTAAQTITLESTADTRLPGRYGLFTSGTQEYLKLGTVLAETPASVTRKLLTQVGPRDSIAAAAAFSGWYYSRPGELHLPFQDEVVGSELGPCPAWFFPAADGGDLWVIQVHGRGTVRAETLRAVPVLHGLGLPTLLVSYRNDGEGPRTKSGAYALGAREWRDVEAAIRFARRRGARRVVLMGWSMGGAIVLQTALSSAYRDMIAGIVLDSPVVDWRTVLRFQAAELGVPAPVAAIALGALTRDWSAVAAGADGGIPFDTLDIVARAAELDQPILLMHSMDDGFVPPDASLALAQARPDLVELEVFDVARHTKLWNYDPERWSSRITGWLRERGLVSAGAAADS